MENLNVNAWVNFKDNENAFLLDVRTADEFNEGHITGATNIDVFSPAFQAEVSKLDKTKEMYVVCRSGGRSSSACGAMDSMGFNKITNLSGGMMGWMGELEK